MKFQSTAVDLIFRRWTPNLRR